jgi:hypothetical protein
LGGLREAGVPLLLTTIRGIVVAHIHHVHPELFNYLAKDGSSFRASDSWLRKFLKHEMKWSLRQSTQAAQKLPPDAQQQIYYSTLRQALSICNYNIPAALRVNLDQTQVVYQQGSSMTYAETGSTQVPTIGAEEKRAFTLNVGVLASGVLLPFQAIYGGKTVKSLPNDSDDGFIEAWKLGFQFEVSKTDTYWSTLETMKQYVITILAPYFTSTKQSLSLEMNQECIWQIDVWPVHTSLEFRIWLHETHPYIILDYVPGGCTGIFQPCDVGIQRILKQSIQQSQHANVIKEVCDQLDSGVEAGNIVLDTKLGALRNRSPRWLVNAYIRVNKPEIVLKVMFSF